MMSSIQHLHCHYHVLGHIPEMAERMKHVASEGLARAYSDALEQTFAGDSSVYVIREVNLKYLVRFEGMVNDQHLAQRWSQQVINGVVKEIAKHDSNCIRFENQADFVSSFIIDLLEGHAWNLWYYWVFRRYKREDLPRTLQEVFLDHRQELTQVFSYLKQKGQLQSVVAQLDKSTLLQLWSREEAKESTLESFRPLFRAALSLLEHHGYTFELALLDNWLSDYSATAPVTPNWQDPTSLANAVAEIIRFIVTRSSSAVNGRDLSLAADNLLSSFDWLDRQRLREHLETIGEVRNVQRLSLTPNQQALWNDLESILPEVLADLDANEPTCLANAFRVYTALITRYPAWTDDVRAKVFIENLLNHWATQTRATATHLLIPESIKQLLHNVVTEPQLQADSSTRAGVALMVRALLDTRFSSLAAHLASENTPLNIGAVLLALFYRWAGVPVEAALNKLLSQLSGDEEVATKQDLQDFWKDSSWAAQERFQTALLKMALLQGMIQAEVLYIFKVDLANGHQALVAGDSTIWSLGKVIEVEDNPITLVQRWLEQWQNLTGKTPRLISDVLLPELSTSVTDREGLEKISSAFIHELASVREGELGLPQADLTLSLTALTLVKLWARWLKGFSDSSTSYLLEQLLRRSGQIYSSEDQIVVELEPRPLDIILEMAGYFEPIENVPWLKKRLEFSLRKRE